MYHLTVVGHLGQDVEVRQAGDSLIANMSVAVNLPVYDGEKQAAGGFAKDPVWIRVVVFRPSEAVQNLGKGSRVMVLGDLRERSYRSQDGETRSRQELIASSVQVITSNERSTESSPTKADSRTWFVWNASQRTKTGPLTTKQLLSKGISDDTLVCLATNNSANGWKALRDWELMVEPPAPSFNDPPMPEDPIEEETAEEISPPERSSAPSKARGRRTRTRS